MRRAAIIPFHSGQCGIVIADGVELPLTLVARESFEVGHMASDDGVEGRKLTTQELFQLLDRLEEIVAKHKVESVVLPNEAKERLRHTDTIRREVSKRLQNRAMVSGVSLLRPKRGDGFAKAVAAKIAEAFPDVNFTTKAQKLAALMLKNLARYGYTDENGIHFSDQEENLADFDSEFGEERNFSDYDPEDEF